MQHACIFLVTELGCFQTAYKYTHIDTHTPTHTVSSRTTVYVCAECARCKHAGPSHCTNPIDLYDSYAVFQQMTISALRKACFSVVHKHRLEHVQHVYITYTNMLYQMSQLWPWTVTLLTLFPPHMAILSSALGLSVRIQEWNRVRFRGGVKDEGSSTSSLSGRAGPETQPEGSRVWCLGQKHHWWDAGYTCEYMAL